MLTHTDTTITPTLPPIAPEIAAMLQAPAPKAFKPMPTREEHMQAFRDRVAKGAQRAVPAHVLALADRLVVESRVPNCALVTADRLIGPAMSMGRVRIDVEHLLAVVCCLRDTPFAYGAGRDLRLVTGAIRAALDCIDDQTHAAEEESETARCTPPTPG